MELTKEELKQLKVLMDKANVVESSTTVTKPIGRPVVVTTANNGIFFGYTEDSTKDTIFLRNGRNCYKYVNGKGFLGLAATGPQTGSIIGDKADVTLRNVTSVAECTEKATTQWEKIDWT